MENSVLPRSMGKVRLWAKPLSPKLGKKLSDYTFIVYWNKNPPAKGFEGEENCVRDSAWAALRVKNSRGTQS